MIIFDSVTKIYDTDLLKKKHTALDKFSFEIRQGSITGFLGPNGAGKTTSIKILLDFVRPTSGKVSYGKELGENVDNALKQIGYLPERPYFYPYLFGSEFIHYMGGLSGMSKSQIQEGINFWAPRLRIDGAMNRKLHFYSKGMLQRIGFLAAIIHRPKLLILDEPASGLDPMGRKELKDVIKEVHNQGATIFFSSHIVSDVEEICDQLVFVKNGKKMYSGPLHELVTRQSMKEYTIKYVEKENIKTVVTADKNLDEQLKSIMQKNFPILAVQPKALTLEEIIYHKSEEN